MAKSQNVSHSIAGTSSKMLVPYSGLIMLTEVTLCAESGPKLLALGMTAEEKFQQMPCEKV